MGVGEVRAYKSELELPIELLETLPLRADSDSYPLPELRRTGAVQSRQFSTFVLESDFLRAEFVPALGGRLLKLRDRRLDVELLYSNGPLLLADGGVRGVHIASGLALSCSNGMAPVRAHLDLQAEEEDGGEVWFGELLTNGLSYNLRARLLADRACLQMEVRLLNRGLEPVYVDPRLGAGLDLGDYFVDGNVAISRPPPAGPLTGRTCLNFLTEIVPASGVGRVVAVSSRAVIGFDNECLVISTLAEAPGAKLVLLTAGGQTMETVTDLRPHHLIRFPFAEIGGEPNGLVIRDASGFEILRFDRSETKAIPTRPFADTSGVTAMSKAELQEYQDRVELRHLIASRRTMDSFKAGDYSEAALRAEQALLYNGDDPLAWIEKAIAARLDISGSELEIEDAGELANGHFLAPLEPLLRAEAFLRSPPGQPGSGLLEPLRTFPDELIEVACFLLERGLYVDAGRWLEEISRLSPCPMITYLSAYAFLVASKMKVQAAELVSQAAAMPLAGPFPWRPIELIALKALAAEFPDNARLADFHHLAEKHSSRKLASSAK